MAQDVFISYSKRDKPTADAVCHALESDGIRCWIAPRDLDSLAGVNWKPRLVEAIREAQMMVLVFSGDANRSPQVQREVDIAFEAKNPILPFRIEDVEMNDDLYYCIAGRHWLDALTDHKDEDIKKLVASVRSLVDTERVAEIPGGPLPVPLEPPPVVARRWGRVGGALTIGAAVIALALGGRALFAGPSALERGLLAFDTEDYEAARSFLVDPAANDDPQAQFTLGSMYLNAYGVDMDVERARELFQASADQGFASARGVLDQLVRARLADPSADTSDPATDTPDPPVVVSALTVEPPIRDRNPSADTPNEGTRTDTPANGLLVMVYGEGPGPPLVEGSILRSLRTRREVTVMDGTSLAIIRRDETAIRSASEGDFRSLAELGRQHGAEFMIVGDLESDATPASGPMFSGSAQLDLRMYRVSSGEVVNSGVYRVGMGGEVPRVGRTAADARSQAADEVGRQGAEAARGWLVRALRN